MDGRWTIHAGRLEGGWPEPDACPIPVVPCDDAAVEWAMTRLRVVGSPWLDDVSLTLLRALAESVLRAAGESS